METGTSSQSRTVSATNLTVGLSAFQRYNWVFILSRPFLASATMLCSVSVNNLVSISSLGVSSFKVALIPSSEMISVTLPENETISGSFWTTWTISCVCGSIATGLPEFATLKLFKTFSTVTCSTETSAIL
ncbi:hypothetical protein OGAPHI_005739 [Ogataea philodendri]|uniref:Uncharacterized protein n=1 Tax=Ogataea philodendri TaxID=1378263 RepID=A0A9P8P0B1_9ASCO|nr:uncharacterized protein OGAPHI_005739 [Ogataea philodendri]KAH3662487.1 hypothetical protein OGAPHI_005739 [Ogataea philodendri]